MLIRFLPYINSRDFDKINELNEGIRVNGPGMLNINEQTSARSPLETFDFFLLYKW